jgi:hypothetical protein
MCEQSLQFPVRGTLAGPQMVLQLLKQLGRQQVQQAALGLIQQQLSKGLGSCLVQFRSNQPLQFPMGNDGLAS